MRILHLGKYWRKNGGIETHVKTLCKGLAAAGLDIVNLVSSIDSKSGRFQQDGYTVLEIPTFGIYCSTSIAPNMVFEARRLHQEKKIDIIHLHFPDPMSHLVSMALPSNIPRVITWHSDIVRQKISYKMYEPLQRGVVMKCNALVAGTESHFKSSLQIPSDFPEFKKHVIPYGIEFDWLFQRSDINSRIESFKAKAEGRFMIFALGRHVEYKGFSILIEAMQKVDAFLILGGEGPLTSKLKDQANRLDLGQKLYFAGKMVNDDISACYNACDAFCLPSITPNEAFGIVQIEAMACSKPVICTELNNGVNEVNSHNVTGLTVPPGNVDSLVSAIQQLASSRQLCQRLGESGRQRAFNVFSAKSMCSSHEVLYHQCLTK